MDEIEKIIDDEIHQPHHTSNESELVVRHGKTPGSDNLADEFACSVCLLVAVQPTTLSCGHTSCRICLARWYFSSHKKECPLCRQPYQGHPKINSHIRNVIEKLYPAELKEREQELLDEADKDLLRKYDEELSKEVSAKRNNGGAFCLGVIVAFCAFVIAYLAWYWQFSESNLLAMKPVQLWKPKDVASWLEEFSWASVYANMSIENSIDGNMLLAMDSESLQQFLNVSNPVHQRALLSAVDMLKEHRLKMPSTLWEYKALYPGRCLFLVHGLKEFPRATYFYLWLYFYDDMFLPFVRSATESEQDLNVARSFTLADKISMTQWVYFLFFAALLPQWLVIVLAYQLFSHHYFTPLIVIITATLLEIIEVLDVVSAFRNNWDNRNLCQTLKHYAKQLLHAFMFMVAWPIIPKFICDLIFYITLYIRPFYIFMEMWRKLRRHFNLD